MYNQQETTGKIPVAEWSQQVQHDPAKWQWLDDNCLADVLVSEISVQNDLKPQQLWHEKIEDR